MAHITINVQQVYLDAIKNSSKTIEGRLATEKYRSLRPGDVLTIYNNEQTDMVTGGVVNVYEYADFEAAFREWDFRLAIPEAQNVGEALAVYEQFYSRTRQQDAGVVFIELSVVERNDSFLLTS